MFDYDEYRFCEGCGLPNAECICSFTEQDWKNFERQKHGPDKCPFCDAPLKGNQYYIQTGQCDLCNKEIVYE